MSTDPAANLAATDPTAAFGLTVRQLVKSYPSGEQTLTVLDGLSLTLSPGENAAIVGPSGCGKSTLLYILGTLEPPTSGQVEIAGQRPFELPAADLPTFRNRTIGFIFQEHHLMPQLSVRENVLLPGLAAGALTDELRTRADALIDRVGLGHRRDHLPGRLSGGERQRVAVARALLLSPPLLLADEPTGSLDEANSERIAALLLEMQQENGSMLLCVTHNLVMAQQFQKTLHLSQGRFQTPGASAN